MDKQLTELRETNLRFLQSGKDSGNWDGLKRLLTDLYPDNAHFIYELLQNAEDPEATTVRFTLTSESIEFEHNGKRLFNYNDVESILRIGHSTKRSDPTAIGKFGVGFKAVFAYTQTPEIHSGDLNFRIKDLVVPEFEGVKRVFADDKDTHFVFPFDHLTKNPEQATSEIERALRALGDNTLLFLRHIRKIEYLLPDGSLGSIERFERENGRVEIFSRHPGGDKKTSNWLRFKKEVMVTDEENSTQSCGVAIAYLLEWDEGGTKKKGDWKIIPVDRGQVSIFFPAEKETSNLKFHMHAPFASTVARDSVRDTPVNHELLAGISELLVESLMHIRDSGRLSMNFLSVLPNPDDNLNEFYEPLRQDVIQAFQEKNLTPTTNGDYRPAKALLSGPAKIHKILCAEDLRIINGWEASRECLWVKNTPPQSLREERFLNSLGVEKWGLAELSRSFKNMAHRLWPSYSSDFFKNWLSSKENSWLLQFYGLLEIVSEENHDFIYGISL